MASTLQKKVRFGAPRYPLAHGRNEALAIQQIKIRPRPDHYHRDGQVVCERCMSKLVSSGNPLVDALSEYFYVAKQIVFLCVQTVLQITLVAFSFVPYGLKKIRSSLFAPTQSQASEKAHVHENGQPVCEECLTKFASSGSKFVDNLRELTHMSHEVLLITAQFVLFASIGIGSLVAAMFPGVTGQKSAYDEKLDSQYKARKQKDWEALQRDSESGRAYDEERDEQFEAHHADLRDLKKKRQDWNDALDREWKRKVKEAVEREEVDLKEYDKNRGALNSSALNSPKLFAGTELAEDDHLIKEISNTIKGIESGVEDPEKLRKVSEELMKHRKDTAAKDARRRELLNKYKDKDWEAHRLYSDADKAFGRGEIQTGEGLYRRAQGAQSEANGLYNEFLSV